ncbi:MAG: helix-turn-helix domain-containing protein [Opitutaceae bacterium]
MINQGFGKAVRSARKAQGLTQAGLRDLSDVSLSAIHKIENGRDDLSLTSVLAVADALGIRLIGKSPLGEEIDLNG